MSIVLVRDSKGIYMINTQTWHISTLVNLTAEGEKFPDLHLMLMVAGNDHSLVMYTLDKADKFLMRCTYSNMLKFCL